MVGGWQPSDYGAIIHDIDSVPFLLAFLFFPSSSSFRFLRLFLTVSFCPCRSSSFSFSFIGDNVATSALFGSAA